MKRLTEKFWLVTAAFSLLLMMSTFVAVTGNHQASEEISSELIDIFEEAEAVAERSERKQKRNRRSSMLPNPQVIVDLGILRSSRFFKSITERDRFNGIGAFLVT